MTDKGSHDKGKKISLFEKIKLKFFFLFKLNSNPVVKVYHGFGNAEKIIVLGQVFRLSPMPRKTYRKNWITNLFSIIRLFMVVPFSNAKISVEWNGKNYPATVSKDGFFRLEIITEKSTAEGWHSVIVTLEEEKYRSRNIKGHGKILIPFASSNGFISDIDDTFLVSHSSRMRRRLYVLFTKNARTRKPFEGVVNHYRLLAGGGESQNVENPFFYVSGSEWNLYDFIVEFSRANGLPDGIFLLSRLKRISEFLKSGQNNLSTKFMRIVRIMETYPELRFTLFGDDSQQDPKIYSSIVDYFPGRIFAVYIRRVHKSNAEKTQMILTEMENKGVHCCYFEHSAQAILHSKKIGLISARAI